MVQTTLLETKRQRHIGPAVCSIRICLDGCKTASLGMAIGRDLVSNWDGEWQNVTIHIAHSVIPLCTNSNPTQCYMVRGILTRNKTDVAFCWRGQCCPNAQ